MYPNPANPSSFKYPWNHLLKFYGIISDKEMSKPDPKNLNHDNDPCVER